MIRTVSVRALKDRLSAFLRDVRRGDRLLVTDHGEVIAEIREPTLSVAARSATFSAVERLVNAGLLRRGLQNRRSAYRRSDMRLSADIVDAALDNTRGEKH